MLSLPVAEEVFNFLASDPAGPMASVLTAAHKPESPIFDSLNLFLTSIPKDVVAETCRDQNFKFCWNQAKDIDRMARIWIAERFLSDEIARRRLVALRNEDHSLRPAPYDHPALTDVAVDDEGLVPLSSFELDGSRLIHNGFAFTIFCTTSAPNSTYWVANILLNMATGSQISVRLDPFLLGPDADFPEMLYRMWQYGRPLDWQRISEIREPEHGRWIPKYSTDHGQSTDFCWEPRNGEVHFLCEELPKTDRVECEAARYFHAIYLPSACNAVHVDGALRVYTRGELDDRSMRHVRNSGKCGVRRKIFRTDTPVSRDRLSEIAQAFYVWNEDVRSYFYRSLALEADSVSHGG